MIHCLTLQSASSYVASALIESYNDLLRQLHYTITGYIVSLLSDASLLH